MQKLTVHGFFFFIIKEKKSVFFMGKKKKGRIKKKKLEVQRRKGHGTWHLKGKGQCAGLFKRHEMGNTREHENKLTLAHLSTS